MDGINGKQDEGNEINERVIGKRIRMRRKRRLKMRKTRVIKKMKKVEGKTGKKRKRRKKITQKVKQRELLK